MKLLFAVTSFSMDKLVRYPLTKEKKISYCTHYPKEKSLERKQSGVNNQGKNLLLITKLNNTY